MKVTVVPLVVGALGTPAKVLKKRWKNIGIETKITELHEVVLIHASRILRKILEVLGVLLIPYHKNETNPLVEIKVQPFNNSNNNNK